MVCPPAACHILECRSGMAQDVISTIGQAFELRFKQYLKNPSMNTSCERSAKSSIIIWLTNFFLRWIVHFISFHFISVFLGPHPRLGIELELQVPAYTTATATRDLSHVCGLDHSSWQPRILNPLIEARDRTQILIDTNQVRYCWAMMGTPNLTFKI